jgi:glycosyltransferase involved in cell wall biosynthesis
MPHNIRIVGTYPPRRCGIGTFSRDLANALEHFTGEVGSIRVTAIDSQGLPYSIPVDLVIDQYDPKSWEYGTRDILARANESPNPTAVILQHEYGLDPDKSGEDGRGTNFVEMAKAFGTRGLVTLVYLHTVLDNPDEHQRAVLQDLARYSNGLIVTTESAVHILQSPPYNIEHAKLNHIDHGIRMQHPSQYDRLAVKQQYRLEDHFLVTTLGLLSPDKGIEYGIRAYGRLIDESFTDDQRKMVVYLIAGQFHPDYLKAEGGNEYRTYQAALAGALEQSKVRWCRVKDLSSADFEDCDVIFLDCFLDEMMLLNLYAATNVMVLPYLNMQQISSGILADTVGSGRVAITTKFRYAMELIHSNKPCREGLVIGRHARGILVDAGEPSVEQIAQAVDYLLFHKQRRLAMERQAHQRGYQMRWNNTAWALLQNIEFVSEEKQIISGRAAGFARKKPSALELKRH